MPTDEPQIDKKELAEAKEVVDDLRKNYNSIRIDGDNVTAPAATTGGAARLAQLDAETKKQLRDMLDDARRDSKHRKEIWENPLTRPGPGEKLPVHFVIDVDTENKFVRAPMWKRCHAGDCPEVIYEKRQR